MSLTRGAGLALRSVEPKKINAEASLLVKPLADEAHSRGLRQRFDFPRGVLVAVLRTDRFSDLELYHEFQGVDLHPLGPLTHEVHLDSPEIFIIDRSVVETVEVKVSAQISIDS